MPARCSQLALTLCFSMTILYYYGQQKTIYAELDPTETVFAGPPANATVNNSILIVAWNPFFHFAWKFVWERDRVACPSPTRRCELTADRSRVASADAVLFHYPNHEWGNLPAVRHASQTYIFMMQESPLWPYSVGYNMLSMNAEYDTFFNWTMTYRRDSDVPMPYFEYRRRAVRNLRWKHDAIQAMGNRSKPVAWMASNCVATPSKREELVSEMRRWIQVDIFGSCGISSCTPSGDNFDRSCEREIRQHYWLFILVSQKTAIHRFYLAFENAVCLDYVTEKVARALHTFIVPIVLKDAVARPIAPPRSYIAVDSFATIQDLAAYLLFLTEHPDAYLEYFRWRDQFEIVPLHAFCDLCDKLHDRRGNNVINDLKKWHADGKCDVDYARNVYKRMSDLDS